jgi:hypothetical protein
MLGYGSSKRFPDFLMSLPRAYKEGPHWLGIFSELIENFPDQT